MFVSNKLMEEEEAYGIRYNVKECVTTLACKKHGFHIHIVTSTRHRLKF